jgi:hypothetical protein
MAGDQPDRDAAGPAMGDAHSVAGTVKRARGSGVPVRSGPGFRLPGTLEILCFARYALYLHFGDEIVVTVEGDFAHTGAGEAPHRHSFALQNSRLMRLPGQRVEDLDVLADGTLRFDFSNGDRLSVGGRNGPYQAYHIRHAGGEITV